MQNCRIMDAGPGLNFLSVHKERILFDVLGTLSVPETVEQEILDKSRRDQRFAAAQNVWKKLPDRLLSVIPDDATAELAAAVQRITSIPFEERIQSRRDLGETMVIAHAVVAAETGHDVLILIDERHGTRIANQEAARLDRLRETDTSTGRIRLVTTLVVLEKAAGSQGIATRNDMRRLYERLRHLDDGLPPIEDTNLLSEKVWDPVFLESARFLLAGNPAGYGDLAVDRDPRAAGSAELCPSSPASTPLESVARITPT